MTRKKNLKSPQTVRNAANRAEETLDHYLQHALLETGAGTAKSMPAALFLDHALALASDVRHLAGKKRVPWKALLRAADRGYREDIADGRGKELKPRASAAPALPRGASPSPKPGLPPARVGV